LLPRAGLPLAVMVGMQCSGTEAVARRPAMATPLIDPGRDCRPCSHSGVAWSTGSVGLHTAIRRSGSARPTAHEAAIRTMNTTGVTRWGRGAGGVCARVACSDKEQGTRDHSSTRVLWCPGPRCCGPCRRWVVPSSRVLSVLCGVACVTPPCRGAGCRPRTAAPAASAPAERPASTRRPRPQQSPVSRDSTALPRAGPQPQRYGRGQIPAPVRSHSTDLGRPLQPFLAAHTRTHTHTHTHTHKHAACGGPPPCPHSAALPWVPPTCSGLLK
jgi:hypothetical protein